MGSKQLEKAIKDIGWKRTVDFNSKKIKLACLIREEDRRPFQADWWKGKQSYIVAVDDNGNFILRHCGGYIFRIHPKSESEEVLAKSEGATRKLDRLVLPSRFNMFSLDGGLREVLGCGA